MKNAIKIPTYEALIPDNIYGRRAEPVSSKESDKKFPATQILQISRHTIPFEEEIISFIQSAARDYNLNSRARKKSEPQEFSLDRYMKMLPPDELVKIQDGKQEVLSHLREHYHAGDYQAGRTFFQAINGALPDEVLRSHKKDIEKGGVRAYEKLVGEMKIRRWLLGIRLEGKDGFPDNSELEYLLDRGVRTSDVFLVSGDYREYEKVADQARLFGKVFSSLSEARKIPDLSDTFLRSRAATTMQEFAVCSSRGARGGLSEGLMDGGLVIITGGAMDEREEPEIENPFGDFKDGRPLN